MAGTDRVLVAGHGDPKSWVAAGPRLASTGLIGLSARRRNNDGEMPGGSASQFEGARIPAEPFPWEKEGRPLFGACMAECSSSRP